MRRPLPPILPLRMGTVRVIPPPYESSHWERHVDLRLIPAASLGAALYAHSKGSPGWAVLAIGLGPLLVTNSIWPLSGGPSLPLYRAPAEEPA